MDEKVYTRDGLYKMLNENPHTLDIFKGVRSLSCPVCGCENVHMKKPIHKTEEYEGWIGRGEAIEIPMYCESGCHQWIVGFGHHKGNTGMFLEITQENDMTPEETAKA